MLMLMITATCFSVSPVMSTMAASKKTAQAANKTSGTKKTKAAVEKKKKEAEKAAKKAAKSSPDKKSKTTSVKKKTASKKTTKKQAKKSSKKSSNKSSNKKTNSTNIGYGIADGDKTSFEPDNTSSGYGYSVSVSSSSKWGTPTKKVKTKKDTKTYTETLKKKATQAKTTKKSKKLSKKSSTKVSKNKKKKTKTVVEKTLTTTKKYTKGSKKVKVTEVTKTTTTTYTYKKVKKGTGIVSGLLGQENAIGEAANINDFYPDGIYDIRKLAPTANSALLKAFDALDMICKIDHTCAGDGLLNMKVGVLTVPQYGDEVLVKLGTFLYEITGLGESYETEIIFDAESGNIQFWPANTSFGDKSDAMRDYFSTCFCHYTTSNAMFRTQCPKTAAYIDKALAKLTDSYVDGYKETHSSYY